MMFVFWHQWCCDVCTAMLSSGEGRAMPTLHIRIPYVVRAHINHMNAACPGPVLGALIPQTSAAEEQVHNHAARHETAGGPLQTQQPARLVSIAGPHAIFHRKKWPLLAQKVCGSCWQLQKSLAGKAEGGSSFAGAGDIPCGCGGGHWTIPAVMRCCGAPQQEKWDALRSSKDEALAQESCLLCSCWSSPRGCWSQSRVTGETRGNSNAAWGWRSLRFFWGKDFLRKYPDYLVLTDNTFFLVISFWTKDCPDGCSFLLYLSSAEVLLKTSSCKTKCKVLQC